MLALAFRLELENQEPQAIQMVRLVHYSLKEEEQEKAAQNSYYLEMILDPLDASDETSFSFLLFSGGAFAILISCLSLSE